MKSKEQIINDSIKQEIPPVNYNLLEMHCFLALKQLLVMFHNKQITPENATRTKRLILGEYERQCKEYNFKESMFNEYIENTRETEELRIELRKLLNSEEVITEDRLREIIKIAVEILATVFKGEF